MSEPTHCPVCNCESIYPDGALWICPECTHEWNPAQQASLETAEVDTPIKDANGAILQDGDAVSVIKDLKVKGTSLVVKVGTKVKNIRLVESTDGHNIACKIDGIGAMNLKSEFVRKV